jgi:type VI secretion system protein ImpH
MAAESGTKANPLEETRMGRQLADNACSFGFFQAVTLLERLSAHKRPVGGFSSPHHEAVHFKVNQRLGFPASEIQKLELDSDGRPEMTVNFMGLTGPMGTLPYVYSELMLERARAKDHGLAAFFDIFNHRAISLFYRAWQRSNITSNYGTPGRDLFTNHLMDLVGLGTQGLRDRQDVDDHAWLHYVSMVASQSRSAVALEQIIADYFEVAVEIQQFAGGWNNLDESTQCVMQGEDSVSCQVGLGAVVGDAVWDRQSRVRIRLGPMSMESYDEFLPEGSSYRALQAMTRFFSNQCLEFELQLVLDRTRVPAVELDLDAENPARLGWVSWAKTAPLAFDPDETILTL